MDYNKESNLLRLLSLILLTMGVIILTIGLTDTFIADKASFWSVLYMVIGFVLIRGKFNYLGYLKSKELEKKLMD